MATYFRQAVLATLNAISTDEVDRLIDAAEQAGASKILTPKDRGWGGRSGYFFDPEGNAWEVAWSPRARFDQRGALLPWA